MKAWVFIATSIGIIIFVNYVSAVSILYVPEKISANASFAMIVDPQEYDTSFRVTWALYNGGFANIGLFPTINGRGICYFSDTDANATCGPSPFRTYGKQTLFIHIVTPGSDENRTETVNVGKISIPVDNVQREGNTVYMYIAIPQYITVDSLKYSIYNEDFTVYSANKPLEYSVKNGRYEGNITLNPGTYYFAFVAKKGSDFGGNLIRIVIPRENFVKVEMEKTTYYLGETILISGSANEHVSGALYYPNGSKFMEISSDVDENGEFSIIIETKDSMPTGSYKLKITHPANKEKSIIISRLLDIKPSGFEKTAGNGQNVSLELSVKNTANEVINISVETPDGISVDIEKNVLSKNDETKITLTAGEVHEDIYGNVLIKTNVSTEHAIPIKIKVSEAGASVTECEPCKCNESERQANECNGAGYISIEPKLLYAECIANEPVTLSFKIKNNGDNDIEGISYEIEDTGMGDNDLSELDSFGLVNFDRNIEKITVSKNNYEIISMTITPKSEGKYIALLKIKNGNNEGDAIIYLSCYGNISEKISEMKNSILTLPNDVYSSINKKLSDAENALEAGNYELARMKIEEAESMKDVAESITPNNEYNQQPQEGGGDNTIIYVILLLLLVGIGAVWYLKYRQPQSEEEEEYNMEDYGNY